MRVISVYFVWVRRGRSHLPHRCHKHIRFNLRSSIAPEMYDSALISRAMHATPQFLASSKPTVRLGYSVLFSVTLS
jgi:hypothetical protein